jgi:hypothetical protein
VLVNQFEKFERRPRDIYIKALSNLFDVREDWILYGKGEMKQNDEERDEISAIAAEITSILRNSSV